MTTSGDSNGSVWGTDTFYDKWVKSQGIPVVRGYAVEDLGTLPVEPWTRKGGKGSFVILEGAEGMGDAYVCEIPNGGTLKPQRHLFEEMIYILSGSGATTIWWDGKEKQTFEWQAGSLFAPPLNVWHQHFNGRGDAPARYLAVTSAPLMLNLVHNEAFLFDNDFSFTDRYDGGAGYFNASGGKLLSGLVWESNFVADLKSFKLYERNERGAGGTNVKFELSNNTMAAHMSEFPVGTYKKAHRHGPSAHVIVLSGEGFSLMWPEGQPPVKLIWHGGSMFVPPNRWFHQHFNVGSMPARYLALRWNSRKFPMGKAYRAAEDVKTGGSQIEYGDQSLDIDREFRSELAKRGLTSRMSGLL